ncbi:MAG: GAF domain-containing protein [Bacteroidota bacterium]
MTRKTDQKWEAVDLLGSYHILFETMSEGVFFQMANGTLVEVNPAALELLGLAREEFIGRNTFSDKWDIIREDGAHCPAEEHPSAIAMKTGTAVMHKILAVRNAATNQYVWIVANAIPQFRKGEIIPYCVMVTMHDIGWRKSEEDIRKALIRILEYSHVNTLDKLLTATLDELELLTGSKIGFYHFLEADQQTLSLQNWSTATLKKFCTAEGKGRHYNVAEAGVWVDCIRQRRPVIHNNIATLPHLKGMPSGHAEVIRELALPVFIGDKIVAILGVGNKPTDYTDQDINVVSRFADLAWEIAERKSAEESLRENGEKFRLLFEELKAGITLTHQGIVVEVNKRMTEALGLKNRNEMIGKNLLDYITPESRQRAQQEIALFQNEEFHEISIELNFLHSDNSIITVDMRGSRVEIGGKIYGLSVYHDVTQRKNT